MVLLMRAGSMRRPSRIIGSRAASEDLFPVTMQFVIADLARWFFMEKGAQGVTLTGTPEIEATVLGRLSDNASSSRAKCVSFR
ncbi:hypothetical protein [Ensifer sp. LBL]|uniref:hypothetical protein n=1 Tax=Ensifer sp. LBL TaxID=2991056 RepID=UPI003D191262